MSVDALIYDQLMHGCMDAFDALTEVRGYRNRKDTTSTMSLLCRCNTGQAQAQVHVGLILDSIRDFRWFRGPHTRSYNCRRAVDVGGLQ